jgi:hypothetical protein
MHMAKNKEKRIHSGPYVDKSLIRMFLKMTPEERIQANDNAINAISELKTCLPETKNQKPQIWAPC